MCAGRARALTRGTAAVVVLLWCLDKRGPEARADECPRYADDSAAEDYMSRLGSAAGGRRQIARVIDMDKVTIERRGGVTGVGSSTSRLRAIATLSADSLAPADRSALEALFAAKESASPGPGPSYIVTWGARTIRVPEGMMPPNLASLVREEIR
jgi:hypothetical protein